MINYLSDRLTSFFITHEIISADEKAIYKYGSEVTISTLLGYTLIIATGLILRCVQDSVLFLMCFVSIRLYSGGYHADTYVKCNSTFVSVFLAFLLIKNIIPLNLQIHVGSMLMIVTLVIVMRFSPIENKHKPLSDKEKARYRKVSIVLVFVWGVVAVSSLCFTNGLFNTISMTMSAIAALMVVEIIKQKKKARKNNEKQHNAKKDS